MADSILNAFTVDQYRIGDSQAILYDRTRTAIFPEGYLGWLYLELKGERYSNRPGNGTLENLFCGLGDLSFDNIVAYLAKLPLIIMGKWEGNEFETMGLAFPTVMNGTPPERQSFIGYGFLRQYWGSAELEGLAMLGLSLMFQHFGLSAIHGVRYRENTLTARFAAQYGFRDDGVVPRYMVRRGVLVDAVVSTLMREDFEAYIKDKLIQVCTHG